MKYQRINNDKSKRLFFKKIELKKIVLHLLNRQIDNCLSFAWKSIETKLLSKVEIKNYCILTGRSRGVFREFKLSRISLRKVGAKGLLSGLKKKSW